MARPQYENEETLKKEKEIATKFAKLFHLIPQKLPISYRIDFAFCDSMENVVMYVEAKARKVSINKYTTLFISSMKYKEALEFLQVFKKPVYFVIEWTDVTGYWEVKEIENPDIRWGGNKQRDDGEGDMEPVLHIPISEFTTLDLLKEALEAKW